MGNTVIETWVRTKKGNSFAVSLPSKTIVCPDCNGKGSYVNPNIDGNGINPEEFREDPDFAESYFSGLYDVACDGCKGRNVVEVVDESKLSPKMLERYHRALELEAADRREELAERRMCGGW